MDAMKDRLARRAENLNSPCESQAAPEMPMQSEEPNEILSTEPDAQQIQDEVCGTQADPIVSAGSQIEIPDLGIAPQELAEAKVDQPITMPELNLPQDKKYFRIGEVSEIVGVEPYVLRYWENEFSTVRPTKSKSGQRVYARKDVESLYYIRHLLHVEKFSIKGAKKKLLEIRRQNTRVQHAPLTQKREQNLKQMIHELKELIHMVRTDPGLSEEY